MSQDHNLHPTAGASILTREPPGDAEVLLVLKSSVSVDRSGALRLRVDPTRGLRGGKQSDPFLIFGVSVLASGL
jgi:hypothetical protein